MPEPPASRAKTMTHRAGGRLPFGRSALAQRTCLALAEDLPLEEWKKIGQQLRVITDSSAWWLGDWLNYGQQRFPDRYRRAIVETSLDYQTLRNYAWVAARYRPETRRPALSFQHHAEVAALPEEEREAWLDRAEKAGWSRNQLRKQLRAARSLPAEEQQGDLVKVLFMIARDRMNRWQEAASRADRDLIDWMTAALDRAAASIVSGSGR